MVSVGNSDMAGRAGQQLCFAATCVLWLCWCLLFCCSGLLTGYLDTELRPWTATLQLSLLKLAVCVMLLWAFLLCHTDLHI